MLYLQRSSTACLSATAGSVPMARRITNGASWDQGHSRCCAGVLLPCIVVRLCARFAWWTAIWGILGIVACPCQSRLIKVGHGEIWWLLATTLVGCSGVDLAAGFVKIGNRISTPTASWLHFVIRGFRVRPVGLMCWGGIFCHPSLVTYLCQRLRSSTCSRLVGLPFCQWSDICAGRFIEAKSRQECFECISHA